MPQRRWFAFVGLVLLLVPSVLSAQHRWTVTFQPGPVFPTKALSGVDLDPGFGFEGTVGYGFYPHLTAYAGWGWHRITTADLATPFVNRGANVEQTGLVFGVRFYHPVQFIGLRPSVVARAGGTYEHLETENWDGDVTEDSGHGLGGEAGVGLSFDLAAKWTVMPGLRFRSLRRELTIDGVTRKVRLDYLGLDVAVTYRF